MNLGAPAPDFALASTAGGEVRLSTLREVLPISVDSVPTLREFKAKHGLKLDLLSDFKRDVSRAYDVLLEDRFYSKRAYFLIDRQGLLRWRHVEAELGQRRDDAELLRQIHALEEAA